MGIRQTTMSSSACLPQRAGGFHAAPSPGWTCSAAGHVTAFPIFYYSLQSTQVKEESHARIGTAATKVHIQQEARNTMVEIIINEVCAYAPGLKQIKRLHVLAHTSQYSIYFEKL